MPRTPKDYSKMCYYRLVCRDPSVKEVYVGSTACEVDRRYTHKSACTNEKSKDYNLLVYRFIRSMGGWDNWQLIVHEKRAVKDEVEDALRERYWVEFYNATLNSIVPSRTDAQYRADHRDDKKITSAAYRVANEAHIKENHDCPCGGKHTTNNKSQHFKTARHIAYQATL